MSDDLLRPELGNFNSIVCFKALVTGMEAALGERTAAVGLIAAGRERGQGLVESLGLAGSGIGDPTALAAALDDALGANGTRLCKVCGVNVSGGTFSVSLQETVCSAGEPQGSPRKLSFTLGAVMGAMESITGRKLKATQTESVLRGGVYDTIEFTDRM